MKASKTTKRTNEQHEQKIKAKQQTKTMLELRYIKRNHTESQL